MFTGIVQSQGRLVEARPPSARADGQLTLRDPLAAAAAVGDSIAINGVCLTAVSVADGHCRVDASMQTWRLSALSTLRVGDPVNVEPALRADGLLGGHWVSGHVDGQATVLRADAEGGSHRFRFASPAPLARYIANRGSVCLDGVSLTVSAVDGVEFEVNVIPHTMRATRFSVYRPGSRVNLEVDIVARYLERLLAEREERAERAEREAR